MVSDAHHGKLLESQGIHASISYTYANSAARLLADGFEEADINKFAIDSDTNQVFILRSIDPIEWVSLAGEAELTGNAGGDLDGEYPNPTVVDLTMKNEARGDILYFNGFNWVVLHAGTEDYVLTTKGSGADPVWEEGGIGDINTDRLLGRDTAGLGEVEELTVSGGIEFTGSGGIRRSGITGDITISAGSNTASITSGVIVNSDINGGADIDVNKLASGSDGYVLVSNSGTISWEDPPLAGDIEGTLSATVIGSGVIVNDDINAAADIEVSKLAAGSDGYVLVSNSGIAVWAEAPAGGTSSNYYVYIYQPGGTQEGNVYTDLSDLSAQLNAVSATGFGIVYFDGSLNGEELTLSEEIDLKARFDLRIISTKLIETTQTYAIVNPKSIISENICIIRDASGTRPIVFELAYEDIYTSHFVHFKNLRFESSRSLTQRAGILIQSNLNIILENITYEFWLLECSTTLDNRFINIKLINTLNGHLLVKEGTWTNTFFQITTDSHDFSSYDVSGTNYYSLVRACINNSQHNIPNLNSEGLFCFEGDGTDSSTNRKDLTFKNSSHSTIGNDEVLYAPGHHFGLTSMKFDGTYYAMRTSADYLYTTAITVEAIIYITNYSNMCIVSCNDDNDNCLYYLGVTSNGRLLYFSERNTSQTISVVQTGNDTIPLNEWVHVAFTKNSTTELKLYINGKQLVSGTLGGAPSSTFSTQRFRIGTNIDFDNLMENPFIGYISCLKIDNTTYSPTDISKDVRDSLTRYKNALEVDNKNISLGVGIKGGTAPANIYLDLEAQEYLYYQIASGYNYLYCYPPSSCGQLKLILYNPSGYTLAFGANFDGLGNTMKYETTSPFTAVRTLMTISYFIWDDGTYNYFAEVSEYS